MNNRDMNAMPIMTRIVLLVVFDVVVIVLIMVLAVSRLDGMLDGQERIMRVHRLHNAITQQQLLARDLDVIAERLPAARRDAGLKAALMEQISGTEEKFETMQSAIDDEGRWLIPEERENLDNLWRENREAAVRALTADSAAAETSANDFADRRKMLSEFLDKLERHYPYDLSMAIRRQEGGILGKTLIFMVGAMSCGVVILLWYIVLKKILSQLRLLIGGLDDAANEIENASAAVRDLGVPGAGDLAVALSATSASVTATTDDLDALVNGEGSAEWLGRKTALIDTAGADRQYLAWAALPPDVRSALIILARRLGGDKREES